MLELLSSDEVNELIHNEDIDVTIEGCEEREAIECITCEKRCGRCDNRNLLDRFDLPG
jgi:uncharacterized protein YggL (DUF469 family)